MPPSRPKPAFVGGLFLTSLITPFLLPDGIVRLLPLIGSLVTLIWDADVYYFLSPWLTFDAAAASPSNSKSGTTSTGISTSTSTSTGTSARASANSEREELNRQLGQWYTAWTCSPGVLFAIISLPLSWSSGGITIYRLYASSSSPSSPAIAFHALGLALAIAHMPVGGKGFPLVKIIGEGRSRTIGRSPNSDSKASGTKKLDGLDSIEALRKWLDMHGWRCLTVDLPAFICFAMGTVLAIP